MAGAVADRTWRDSSPETIEVDLATLWREAGQGDVAIARAVMSNLIVVLAPSGDRRALSDVAADLPLDHVVSRHPSRTIVLEHCHRDAPATPFAAGVGILTFGPPTARYGVEQIVVRSACPEAPLLSILRRVVRGDVPTSVWWTEDLSEGAPFDPLLTIGRQLLYDSRQWKDVGGGLAAVVPLVDDRRIDVADLNWRRLAPMRRALLHLRGPLTAAAWRGATVHVGHAAGEVATALLLAGWLRGERRSDPIRVDVDSLPKGDTETILRVTLGDGTATQTPRGVDVTPAAAPPFVVAAPKESDADAIAAELRALSPDRALLCALRGAQQVRLGN
jgi:glucose-6-phosphate dehydrogenase assembly protein OpcA